MNEYMKIAKDLAADNLNTNAGGPFGACVVKNGKIIDFWFGWTRNSFYCVDCVVTFRRPENT